MPCRHEHVTWPQSGWQRCLDCAARREYSDIGVEPGEWLTEPEIVTEESNGTK